MNPAPFTLRELLWMAESEWRDRWTHTSSIMAVVANTVRTKGQRPIMPADFNPYLVRDRRARGLRLTPENLHLLKAVFLGKRQGPREE